MGVNYKGENLYEFIFTNKSNLPLVDGESWDKTPADGFPSPPSPNFIKEVSSLTTSEITLNVIQDSNFFGVYDDMKVWEYLDFFAAAYKIEKQRRMTLKVWRM